MTGNVDEIRDPPDLLDRDLHAGLLLLVGTLLPILRLHQAIGFQAPKIGWPPCPIHPQAVHRPQATRSAPGLSHNRARANASANASLPIPRAPRSSSAW